MSETIVFTVGGTVQASNGLYIPRHADSELLELCRSGKFAYVLTPRQLGKSSLMVRTAEKLTEEGIRSVIIDLSQIGVQVKPEEWYVGLLGLIEDQLGLDTDVLAWWKAHSHLGVTQRLTMFFEEVLLKEVNAPVVVFVDEIDTTLSLSFTDDFFAAIRYFYNARALSKDYQRLSFVLIGVATPGDLIRDPQRTPFNIGQRVDLTDFTFDEALPLAAGLGLSEEACRKVLKWVLKWTSGHPYLTQRLYREMADQPETKWTEAEINDLVTETFLSPEREQDNNLQFVRDMLTERSPDPEAVLKTYQAILRNGSEVPDEEQSLVKSHLKLSGAVRRENGNLSVRNRIYAEVFNDDWVAANVPVNWKRRLTRVAAIGVLTLLVLSAPLGVLAYVRGREAMKQRDLAQQQMKIAEERRQQAEQSSAEAQSEKQRAQDALERAEEARKAAQAAREEADKQRTIAEQKQREAEQERLKAVAAANTARQAEDMATKAAKAAKNALENEAIARKDAERNALEAQREKKNYQDLVAKLEQEAKARSQRNDLLTKSYQKAYEFVNRNDFKGAIGEYERMLTLYEGDSAGQASTRINIGDLTADPKNAQRSESSAIEIFRTAYDQFQKLGDLAQAADVLVKIGKTTEKSKPDEAISAYETAATTYANAGAFVPAAATYNQLAALYTDPRSPKKDTHLAIQSYENALNAYKRLGDSSSEAATLGKIGDLYNTSADKTTALNTYDLALEAFGRVKDEASQGQISGKKAAIYLDLGDKQAAIDAYKRARGHFQTAGLRTEEYRMISAVTSIFSENKQDARIKEYYDELLASYTRIHDVVGETEILRRFGSFYYTGKHDDQRALDYYQRALKGYIELKDERFQAYSFYYLTRSYAELKRCDEANES